MSAAHDLGTAAQHGYGDLIARLSKLASQPLLLSSPRLVHAPAHPVVIVTRWPTARLRTMVGCPMQLSWIVVVMRPPLYASIDTTCRGPMNASDRRYDRCR